MFRKTAAIVLAVAMLLAATPVFAEESVFSVENPRTEYLTDPIGIDAETPRLTWEMNSDRRGQKQKSYRVVASLSEESLRAGNYDAWDSGTVESDLPSADYRGTLSAQTRVWWKVIVTDQNGTTAESAPAFFETGLGNNGWAGAQWITAEQLDASGFDIKSFTVEADVRVDAGAAGVIFGVKDRTQYYAWQIAAGEERVSWRPTLWETGREYASNPEPGWTGVSLTELGISKADVTEKFARLKIVSEKGKITTYINGIQVYQNDFLPFCLGFVGFYEESGEKGTFDNLKVTDENGKILLDEKFDGEAGFSSGVRNEDGTFTVENDRFCIRAADGAAAIADGRTVNSGSYVNAPALMFRREFSAKAAVTSARLYVTSAGNYEMYLNGQTVTDSYFNPGRTDYSRNLLYQTYDVTSLVQSGQNAIGAYVGEGWLHTKWNNFGEKFGLLVRLDLTYADGTTETVVTDGNWKSYNNGPIRYQDYMNGETYDARCEVENWHTAGCKEEGWIAAKVTTAGDLGVSKTPVYTATPPIRAGEELVPKFYSSPTANVVVYDFGQNMAGTVSVKIKAPAGTKLKFTYGEILNEKKLENSDGNPGTVFRKNLSDAQATDYYICKGDPDGEVFSPTMTSHGFRYMQIEGENKNVYAAMFSDVKALALYTDLSRTGTFESSNELLNRYYLNSYWSNISNFLNTPTDCPQRGERTGWAGDAQLYSRTATFNLDAITFFEKYCKDLRLGQGSNGGIPEAAPAPTWGSSNVVNGWSDAMVIIPWTLYQQYGDVRVLEENFTAMTREVDCLVENSTLTEYGDLERPDGVAQQPGAQYGDWTTLEPTNLLVTNNAYSCYSAQLVSKAATVLGKTEEAKKYADIAEQYRKAWVRACTDGEGKTLVGTQTSYALGLQFHLFDEEDRAAAAKNLVNLLEENNYATKVGFLGINILHAALTENGYAEAAYRLIENEAYPSLLYQVKMGGTTTFEVWNAITETEDNTLQFTNMYSSLNHYPYGAAAEWLYRYVLGIDTDSEQTGYRHLYLHPTPGGTLTYAKGSYQSHYGKIESAWKYENGDFVYDVTIPANATATLTLPLQGGTEVLESGKKAEQSEGVTATDTAGVYELSSGTYSFTVKGVSKGTADPTEPTVSQTVSDTSAQPSGGANIPLIVGACVAGALVLAAVVVVILKKKS